MKQKHKMTRKSNRDWPGVPTATPQHRQLVSGSEFQSLSWLLSFFFFFSLILPFAAAQAQKGTDSIFSIRKAKLYYPLQQTTPVNMKINATDFP